MEQHRDFAKTREEEGDQATAVVVELHMDQHLNIVRSIAFVLLVDTPIE